MKYRLINKTKYSVIIVDYTLLLLMFVGIFFFIFFMGGDGGKNFAIIFISTSSVLLFLYAFYLLFFHSGKIKFSEKGIYLKKNAKVYFVSRNDILIVDIRSDYHVSTIQLKNKSNYILIRKKSDKEFIPIRIFQKEIIKTILEMFICKRNPQDFLFEWEKQPNEKQ